MTKDDAKTQNRYETRDFRLENSDKRLKTKKD